MQFSTAALTDLGLVRRENEDRFLSDPAIGLFGVADGIGGLPNGAEAAECVVTTLAESIRKNIASDKIVDLAAAVNLANTTVVQLGVKLTPSTGLGCTLCVGFIHSGSLQLANVGDSRCYLLRKGELKLLTTDDTVEHEVEMRRARGENIQLDERYRNALTRCMGQPMDLDLTIFAHTMQKGDMLLFCSDGVSRMIAEQAILSRMRDSDSPDQTARGLIADAMAAGGHDNATVVVVRIDAL
jgi:protein phosphatase